MDNELLHQIKQMRALFKSADDRRDNGLPTEIPEVTRINNLRYGIDQKWNLLDLYLPKDYQGLIPVIVHVHGGGWCYGTKETYQFYGLHMAKLGFAFINFNYPLAPDVHFPAQLDCIDSVFHWLEENAKKYHLDTSNVFLSGDSAGAQIAEQYLTCLFNVNYREKFGYSLPAVTVKAATLNCGIYFLNLPGVLSGPMNAYFTPEIVKNNADRLETEKYMTKDLPPIFIMTGNRDMLHDSSIRLDGYLLAKDIDHELHVYGDEEHPCQHVFHLDQRNPIADQCNADEAEFYRKYLGKSN